MQHFLMKLTLKYLFTITAHLTTARMETFNSTWNTQMNSVHLYRSGVLCGSCQQNLSHVLGTSNCKECSSNFLLLIPVFIVAGIALVAFLMLLNLTVSVGTINGLIFYANIVRANHAIFFPSWYQQYNFSASS